MKKKTFTKEDMLDFAFWYRNGLTNLEASQKSIEHNFKYWINQIRNHENSRKIS